jgi:hypothetical protein
MPIGSHYRTWRFWGPLMLGLLAGGGALATLRRRPRLAARLGLVSLGFLLTAGLAGWFIARRRRWVEILPESFRILSGDTVREIGDERVRALAVHRVPHHSNGRLISETRTVRLWLDNESGPEQLTLSNRLTVGAYDPLIPLIDRLSDRLTSAALVALRGQESVCGDNWQLTRDHLAVATNGQQLRIPLSEIAVAERIGPVIRVWREGDPKPCASIPESGKNAWLLGRLLDGHRKGDLADPEAGGPSSFGLGRVLFERAPRASSAWLVGTVGGVLVVLAGLMGWSAVRAADPAAGAVSLMFAVLGGAALFASRRVRQSRFRCYERGVERTTLTGRQVLHHDAIDVFSFESRRNHSHARYTGTTYTLVFADRSREQGRGLFYSTTVQHVDHELEDLRDRVAAVIARRMAQTYARVGSFQWTDELWLQEESLDRSRGPRWFRPRQTISVPYEAITQFEIRDGRFYVWTNYQERAVISARTAAPNFFPGLIVLQGLLKSHQRSSREDRLPSTSSRE